MDYSNNYLIFAPKMCVTMITKEEVQKFLSQFHEKMKIFGIIYRDDRGKNQKTLEELEIVPSYRKVIIENLIVEDYVEGPVIDVLNQQGEMWVFGKDVKGRGVYKDYVRLSKRPNNLHLVSYSRTSYAVSF